MKNIKIFLHKGDIPSDVVVDEEISIDTETMGLNLNRDRLCLIQIKCSANEIHLVQFIDKDYSAPNLKKLLKNNDIIKIFHYARFDILAIYQYLDVLCNNVFCTKIASKMVRTYTNKHGLKSLVKNLLNVELDKEKQTSDWGALELTEEQLSYAASDIIYLSKLKAILVDMLIRENRMNLANLCFQFLPARAILDSLGFDDENDIFKH